MSKIFIWIAVGLVLLCLGTLSYVEFFELHPLNGGLMSPDFRFSGYNYDEIALWQLELGEAGTETYLKWFPNGVNRYLPALVGIAIALLLHQVLNRFPRYHNRSVVLKNLVLSMFSLPYVFFDYFESVVLSDAISAQGNVGYAMIQFASNLTVLKAFFLAISLIVIACFWMASLKNETQSQ